MTRVAICIATYRRPEGLARLLASLERQTFSRGTPAVDVVVVDNDPAGSGEPVCRDRWGRTDWGIDYHVEPQRGISQVRNRAVRAVPPATEWIAFIDDDEEAEADWLDQLLAAQADHRADVVAGPVLPRYDADVPRWAVRSGLFERRRYRTGQQIRTAFTCNVLVRAEVLRGVPGPFDERFALTGGSDSHLFRRLARDGYRLVWCDTAIAHEWVPASRATLGWLVGRGYRAGNVMARIAVELARSRSIYPSTVGKAIAWLGIGAAASPLALVAGRAGLARAGWWCAYGAGLLGGLVGVDYHEYRRTHGR